MSRRCPPKPGFRSVPGKRPELSRMSDMDVDSEGISICGGVLVVDRSDAGISVK